MKFKLLALALFAVLNVNGQTKQVSHSNYKTARKEVYYVLKSDKNFREGEYKSYTLNGSKSTILIEGYYHNNQPDSTWKYYSGGQLVAQGGYKTSAKTGVWIGYTRGFERLKYDFSKKELIAYVPNVLDSVQQFNIINAPNADAVLDRIPIFFNGMPVFKRVAEQLIRYPLSALSARKQGEVVVTFTIDENGKPGNYAIKTNIGYGLEEATLNAIKQIEGEWVPGTIKGREVPVQCEIPVLFAIVSGSDIFVKPNQILILAVGVTSIR